MQYSLLIDQDHSMEWGLNLPEATLFCVVVNAPMWATQTIRDGQVWYWIANAKLTTELPLLTSKPDTIKRLMASLQKKGLINRTTDGLKTFIQITDKGRQWNSKSGREINPDQGGKNFPTRAGNKSPQSYNHSSCNHDSLKDTRSIAKETAADPARSESDPFDDLWPHYPKREGSNPKSRAKQNFNARLKEGHTVEVMAQGLKRYIDFCKTKGQTGTGFVMQAQRFFGTALEFLNDWEVSAESVRPKSDKDYWQKASDDQSWADDLGI